MVVCVGGQVVMVLKKEVMKTQSKELDKGAEYRHLLVQVRQAAAVSLIDPTCPIAVRLCIIAFSQRYA